jgi:hypothetical protein
VVASFSGQKIDSNSSVKLVHELKTIFPVFISCLIIDNVLSVRGTPLDLSSFLFLTPFSLYSYSLILPFYIFTGS